MTTDTTVTEGAVGTAYHGCRTRLTALLADIDRSQAQTPVPTCPGWAVHDVLAHVSGGVVDAINRRMEGAGTDPWTARQVNERRELSIAENLDEWTMHASRVVLLDTAGDLGRQAVADVASHEHDTNIRGQPVWTRDTRCFATSTARTRCETYRTYRAGSSRVRPMGGVAESDHEPVADSGDLHIPAQC